jgi:hypothetical protein
MAITTAERELGVPTGRLTELMAAPHLREEPRAERD